MFKLPRVLPLLVALALVPPFNGPSAHAQVAAPADARFTIVLLNFEGPGHLKEAKRQKEFLEKSTNQKGFYLVHAEGQSTLYYGFYKTVEEREDRNEALRAQADLSRLAAVEVDGAKPFVGAIFISLPTPNPEAPPEWDIVNAQGAYSVEIAAFRGVAERKQAAVDSVREARKSGIEAYFFHGPNTSSVLIGSFPEEAVKITNEKPSAKAGKELLVLPFKPADIPDEVIPSSGKVTTVVAPTFEIVDPLLMEVIRKYPHHAINGSDMVRRYPDPKTGKWIEIYNESMIIDIRTIRRQSILGGGRVDPNRTQAPDSSAVAPRPATPGEGKLKGFK